MHEGKGTGHGVARVTARVFGWADSYTWISSDSGSGVERMSASGSSVGSRAVLAPEGRRLAAAPGVQLDEPKRCSDSLPFLKAC